MEHTHKNETNTQQWNKDTKMEQTHKNGAKTQNGTMSQMGIGLQVNKAEIKSRKEEFWKI
jgi:hypothetical protein